MRKTAVFEVLRGPRGIKIGPQRPLGAFLERLDLLQASWSGLGGLLERSWTALGPKKKPLQRLLKGPKREPRRFPNRVPEATGAENDKIAKL